MRDSRLRILIQAVILHCNRRFVYEGHLLTPKLASKIIDRAFNDLILNKLNDQEVENL